MLFFFRPPSSSSSSSAGALLSEYGSGNAVKSLLGEDDLLWSLRHTEGAFQGIRAYDPERIAPDPVGATPTSPPVGADQSIIQARPCSFVVSFAKH